MTYLLIVSVLGLWGLIFYRLAYNVSGEATIAAVSKMKVPLVEKKIFSIRDTFKLLLNYRDPFSGVIMKEPVQEEIDLALKVPAMKPEPVKLNHIIYTGYIINPLSKRAVSIITINGKEQMMAEGVSIGDVKLLRNRKDSVQVYYKGRNYFIRKN